MDYLNWQPPIKTKRIFSFSKKPQQKLDYSINITSAGKVQKKCGVKQPELLKWGEVSAIQRQVPRGKKWDGRWSIGWNKKAID